MPTLTDADSVQQSLGEPTAAQKRSVSRGVNLTKARGQATRELILTEATALFAMYGYRGTSLRDISERVGISHPGMLHHFSHKEALLTAVLKRARDIFAGIVGGFIEHGNTMEGIKAWHSEVHVEATLISVLRSEAVDPQHPGREILLGMEKEVVEQLTAYFQHMKDQGFFVQSADPAWAARALLYMWMAVFLRENLAQDGNFDEDLGEFLRLVMPKLREQD